MTYLIDDDLVDLRSVVRRVAQELCPVDRVRGAAETGGMADDLWSALGKDVGVLGLAVPVEHGGSGLGAQAVSVVAGELGRVLAPVPFITSSGCSAVALATAGGPVAGQWLPAIAAGDARVAFDLVSACTGAASGGIDVQRHGDEWRLHGTTPPVEYLAQAHLVLLPVRVAGTPMVFALDPADADAHVRVEPTLDQTTPMARIALDGVRATLVAEGDLADAVIERALAVGRVCLMHEQVAVMSECLRLAVDYARVRRQFGAPIGSFQAVQLLCAEMYLSWDAADAASSFVAWSVDRADEELGISLPVAAITCAEGARGVAGSLIQVLGGIGFTWEHDAHLYFKRAQASLYRMGSPESHRRELMRRWELSA